MLIAALSGTLLVGCEENCTGEKVATDQAAFAILRLHVLSKKMEALTKIGVTAEVLDSAVHTSQFASCPVPRRRYFVQRETYPDGTPKYPLWVVFHEYVQAECPECWQRNNVHASMGKCGGIYDVQIHREKNIPARDASGRTLCQPAG